MGARGLLDLWPGVLADVVLLQQVDVVVHHVGGLHFL